MTKPLYDIDDVADLVDDKTLKKMNDMPSYENYKHRKRIVNAPVKPGVVYDDDTDDNDI